MRKIICTNQAFDKIYLKMGFVATIIHFDEYLSNIGEYYLNNGMEKSPA
jgi:hypothetical protein